MPCYTNISTVMSNNKIKANVLIMTFYVLLLPPVLR